MPETTGDKQPILAPKPGLDLRALRTTRGWTRILSAPFRNPFGRGTVPPDENNILPSSGVSQRTQQVTEVQAARTAAGRAKLAREAMQTPVNKPGTDKISPKPYDAFEGVGGPVIDPISGRHVELEAEMPEK